MLAFSISLRFDDVVVSTTFSQQASFACCLPSVTPKHFALSAEESWLDSADCFGGLFSIESTIFSKEPGRSFKKARQVFTIRFVVAGQDSSQKSRLCRIEGFEVLLG